MNQKKHGIVYMASGLSKRFGENKLFVDVDGKLMYRHTLELLETLAENLRKDGALVEVVVVSSYDNILTDATAMGFTAIDNPEAAEGIAASIRLGTKALEADYDEISYYVADQPGLTLETCEAFTRAYWETDQGMATVGAHGVTGNPCIFKRPYYEELIALKGDKGGKVVMMAHRDDVFYYEAPQKELTDIDTTDQLMEVSPNRWMMKTEEDK